MSAVISGTEAAVIATNKIRIFRMAQEGDGRAKAVKRILSLPEDFFGTILVFNNVVNVLIASLIGALTARILSGSNASIFVATAVTSILIILFSEITPKSIANASATSWSLTAGKPLLWIIYATRPLVWIFTVVPKAARKIIKTDEGFGQTLITSSELRFMIDLGEEQGTVESMQGAMLDNVFRFGEKEVRDIMTPRTEIVFVEAGDTLAKFMKIYAGEPHTRFAIWNKETDDIRGTVAVKDVMAAIAKDEAIIADAPVESFMRSALFIPETKRLDQLFTIMRQESRKIAFAVDEFGTVSGLITLTHLVEQIVGRTGEEGERPVLRYSAVSNNVFAMDGGVTIDEANDDLRLGIPEGDYETVAGFFIDFAQKIPAVGDRLTVGHLRMRVIDMEDNRIARLRVEKIVHEGSEASDGESG